MKHNAHKKNVSVGAAAVPPLILFACYGYLSALSDLRPMIPEVLGVAAVAVVSLAVLLFAGRDDRFSYSPGAILILAACFRLLFLFHPPQLSDDIHRYLLDGSQLSAGRNPYTLSPESAALENPALSGLSAKVNHPDLVTIYPPAAQILFAAGTLLGGIAGIKFLFILIDLLLIICMMRLLSALGLPLQRLLLYAWHPLPILEIASSGHLDGACLMFVFAGLWALIPGKNSCRSAPIPSVQSASSSADSTRMGGLWAFWSGCLLSFAVLVKLVPILFFPLWCCLAGSCRRRMLLLSGFVGGLILFICPFYPEIQNSLATLKLYALTWEFSGLLFRFLRDLLHSGLTARRLLALALTVVTAYCCLRSIRSMKISSSQGAFAMDVLKCHYVIAFAFLWTTPTLHPWYGLYLVALLPFFPTPAGLILSWTILLGYRVLIPYSLLDRWEEDAIGPLMIWSGPAAAFVLGRYLVKNAS